MAEGSGPEEALTRTPHGRRVLLALGTLVALQVAVPLGFEELYPFTRAALFPDAPRVFCDYRVVGPDGRTIPPRRVGLQRNYFGLRGFSAAHPAPHPSGVRLPETLDRFGEVASREAVVAAVAPRLARPGAPRWVRVQQRVFGAREDGSVGVVEVHSFVVERP